MRKIKFEKDLLRTASGPDLEFATGMRLLETPQLDLVQGASLASEIVKSIASDLAKDSIVAASKKASQAVSDYVSRQLSKITDDFSRNYTNPDRYTR